MSFKTVVPMSPLNVDSSYICATCKIPVDAKLNEKLDTFEPVSGYWSVEKNEAYCGAECSLEKHTTDGNIKRFYWMIKNPHLTEVSRQKLIDSGKKLAEEKAQKAVMRRATKPNHKSKYHWCQI